MERRKVLAAITAAIATPAGAWLDDPKSGGASEGDIETHFREVRPFVGLTEAEQKVKRFLSGEVQEYIGRLIETPGHAPIVDLWVLCEALLTHNCGQYGDQFGGLLSAIEDVTRSDRRFVAVPEGIHEEVETFIEVSKASDETVIRVPNEIRETVALLIRSLCDEGDGELHIVIERGPHAVRPRRRNETRAIIHVEPWKDAPTGGAA